MGDAKNIKILNHRDAVRTRPGMYIGGTGKAGYHHLLWEILDNSTDEALNDYASFIHVHLHDDNQTITITDNGRGIPVDTHPDKGIPALEVVFTILHAGGKFDGDMYKASGGLHGVGASVVNFLSSTLQADVFLSGHHWQMAFDQGITRGKLKKLEKISRQKTGTSITFTPDPEIFGNQSFDVTLIKERLEVKAFLHENLKIQFTYPGGEDVFEYDGGLSQYLVHLSGSKKPVHEDIITFSGAISETARINVALRWTEDPKENLYSFVNSIPTRNGGTHESGLKAGVVKAIKTCMDASSTIPKNATITNDDIREGLCAIISLIYDGDMEIEGQTKERFNNAEVLGQVTQTVNNFLEKYLLQHPSTNDAILQRTLQASRAREASRAAVRLVTRKKATDRKVTLPGKLADCTSNNPGECEIFLVEGDSAGGSGKMARDRRTQAILPLRGKILNVESASEKAVYKNKEIADIVEALGCGVRDKIQLKNLRYHKVILLMDADSDGHHITTLLLTFFYRYMKPLVDKGHLYIAQPPLYRIVCGSESFWAADDAERDAILKKLGRKSYDVFRFKGLGEMMSDTLRETTIHPANRKLLPVSIQDEEAVDDIVTNLLGRKSQSRYAIIQRNFARYLHNDDLDI